jgi:hypothetical protein
MKDRKHNTNVENNEKKKKKKKTRREKKIKQRFSIYDHVYSPFNAIKQSNNLNRMIYRYIYTRSGLTALTM